jgi:hypothetical protein
MNLSDFKKSLQTGRELAQLLELATSNLAQLRPLGIGPDIITATVSSSILVCIARFEEFLKTRAQHFLDSFDKASPPVTRSQLSPELQLQIVRKNVAAALRETVHGVKRPAADIIFDVSSVATLVSADTIWGDHAIDTHSNPSPETVTEILKVLGISNCWDAIGTRFAILWGAAIARDPTYKSIEKPKDELASLLLWRNQCAHSGSTPPIGPNEIWNMIEFLDCLASALDALLQDTYIQRVSSLGSVPASWA